MMRMMKAVMMTSRTNKKLWTSALPIWAPAADRIPTVHLYIPKLIFSAEFPLQRKLSSGPRTVE